jgi:hypothetical protein
MEGKFTEVGAGFCLDGFDGDGDRYDFISYQDVASADDCAGLCSECPGNFQTSERLVGFEYLSNKHTHACMCCIENGATFDRTVCDDASAANDTFTGTGEIKDSWSAGTLFSSVTCWKVVDS